MGKFVAHSCNLFQDMDVVDNFTAVPLQFFVKSNLEFEAVNPIGTVPLVGIAAQFCKTIETATLTIVVGLNLEFDFLQLSSNKAVLTL